MNNKEYTPEEVALIIAVDQMSLNIKKLGNKKVYNIIEDISMAQLRFKMRHIFIMAGGLIPVHKKSLI